MSHRLCGACRGVALAKTGLWQKIKKSMSLKISLVILLLLGSIACKQVHQPPPQSNTGRKLEVELRMPEPWQHIIIGPSQQKEYLKVPSRFSMFIKGETTGALNTYMIISSEISQLSQQRPIEYTI